MSICNIKTDTQYTQYNITTTFELHVISNSPYVLLYILTDSHETTETIYKRNFIVYHTNSIMARAVIFTIPGVGFAINSSQ